MDDKSRQALERRRRQNRESQRRFRERHGSAYSRSNSSRRGPSDNSTQNKSPCQQNIAGDVENYDDTESHAFFPDMVELGTPTCRDPGVHGIDNASLFNFATSPTPSGKLRTLSDSISETKHPEFCSETITSQTSGENDFQSILTQTRNFWPPTPVSCATAITGHFDSESTILSQPVGHSQQEPKLKLSVTPEPSRKDMEAQAKFNSFSHLHVGSPKYTRAAAELGAEKAIRDVLRYYWFGVELGILDRSTEVYRYLSEMKRKFRRIKTNVVDHMQPTGHVERNGGVVADGSVDGSWSLESDDEQFDN